MNIMNNIQQIFTQYLGQDANVVLVDFANQI